MGGLNHGEGEKKVLVFKFQESFQHWKFELNIPFEVSLTWAERPIENHQFRFGATDRCYRPRGPSCRGRPPTAAASDLKFEKTGFSSKKTCPLVFYQIFRLFSRLAFRFRFWAQRFRGGSVESQGSRMLIDRPKLIYLPMNKEVMRCQGKDIRT